jgi:hypothetical protein
MAITQPSFNADDYLVEDSATATPKHGTTVQAGWGAAAAYLKPVKQKGIYPTDFKFTEQAQLVRFLGDEPFMVYELHWIDAIKEGRRSFVCLGDECPLCTIAGDTPRPKFVFNVMVMTDEVPSVQILTAPITLARQLQAANDDPKLGPLSKYFWAVSRLGTGRDTQYTINRVKASDLAEDWELDAEELSATLTTAVPYGPEAIYVAPREDMLVVARQLIS